MSKLIEKVYPHYPILDRKFAFDQEELTQIELTARIAHSLNEVIDELGGWQGALDKHELSDNITNNRKLSPNGNFTGTLAGRLASLVLAQIDNNADKIVYIANQFSDGQTGLVI